MQWIKLFDVTITETRRVFLHHLFNTYPQKFTFMVVSNTELFLVQGKKRHLLNQNHQYLGPLSRTDMFELSEDNMEADVTIYSMEEELPSYTELDQKYNPYKYRQFHVRAIFKMPETINLYHDDFEPHQSDHFQPCFYLENNPLYRISRSRDVYFHRKTYISQKDRTLYHYMRQSTTDMNTAEILERERYRIKDPSTLGRINNPVFFFGYHINNYLHFIRDTIPYIYWYRILRNDFPDLKLLFPITDNSKVHSFIFDILENFGIMRDDLLIMDLAQLNESVFSNFFLAETSQMIEKYDQFWFDENLFSMFGHLRDEIFLQHNPYQKQLEQKKDMIYISRRTWTRGPNARAKIGQDNTGARVLENEDDLVDLLQRYGIKEVFAEDYNFRNKIQYFNSCSHIFATFGAGIMTGVFTTGVDYHVLNSLSYSLDRHISKRIAEKNKIKSHSFYLKDREKYKNCPWKIDLDKVEKLLMALGLKKRD